jgi:hypothetical protein
MPDIHVPKPAEVSAQVDLAAFVNPIGTLLQVVATSLGNIGATTGQVLSDPIPALRQFGVNQLDYANTVAKAGAGLLSAVNSIAREPLRTVVQSVLSELRAGNVAGAVTAVNNFLTVAGLTLLEPLVPVFGIPSQMAGHLLNLTNLLSTGFSIPLTVGISVLSTLEGTNTQFGISAQNFVDAVRGGDPVGAVSALLNAPIEIAGAFLNGVPSVGNVGILSPNLGLVNVLTVQIPKMIATALATPPPAPLVAKVSSAKLAAAPDLVTVKTDPDPVDTTAASGDTTTTTTTKTTSTSTKKTAKTKPDADKSAADTAGAATAAGDNTTKSSASGTDAPKKKRAAGKKDAAGANDTKAGDGGK